MWPGCRKTTRTARRSARFAKPYVEIDNIFNKTYVASAVPVADSIADANKQAFFAGLTLGF